MGELDYFAMFEGQGIAFVRDNAPQWDGIQRAFAYKWLKLKDDEARQREEAAHRSNEAAQVEQARTARIAKKAAIVAAIAAVVAIPLAIIAIIISTLAWLYPRH